MGGFGLGETPPDHHSLGEIGHPGAHTTLRSPASRHEVVRSVHDCATIAKHVAPTLRRVDVVLVRWPEERHHRERLRIEQVPRLLLVSRDSPPPDPIDCLEDWI